MLKVLLFLKLCLGVLKLWSPDPLTSLSITNALATFGDPFILPRYGKLLPVYSIGLCSFSETFPENTFAVLYNFDSCYFSDLAISTQNSGGIGMIKVDNDNNINYIMIPKDEVSGNSINILSICITKSVGNTIAQYFYKEVWGTYSFDVVTSATAKIDFQMSSNYTLDKEFISVFQNIVNKFSINLSDFKITFCYLTMFTSGLDYSNDCLTLSPKTYCLLHTSTVTGSQKIKNSAAIINYYNSLSGSATDFLNFLVALYSKCEFDYSKDCLQSVLTDINPSLIADTSLTAFTTSQAWQSLTPFYIVNGINYFWPSNIEKTYCLSLTSPPSNCEECSPGCSYSDLLTSSCKTSCNVSSCSFDMLACIDNNGCYDFVIGDGNCNSVCSCDVDCGCEENNDICTTGCLYSDMAAGNCPLACTGSCFAYCSSDYCSPECIYTDLNIGICDIPCTPLCFSLCQTQCSPGCLYSDMAQGLCPISCTDTCFQYCSSNYCSQDCLYSDLNIGICPDPCTDQCKAKCQTECSPGCTYIDMQQGKCPSSCTAECFSYCSIDYCAPECLYSDLDSGICSDTCPNNCLEFCIQNYCADSCSYTDMDHGLCPETCTGNCFESCSADYCSPGCAYSNITDNHCPEACDKKCCGSQKASNSTLIYYILIAPIIITVIGIIVIGIFICKHLNRKKILAQANPAISYSNLYNAKMLLPVPFNRNLNYAGDSICTIDLLGFKNRDPAIILPGCRHIFHPLCISEWLTSVRGERRCPNCNSNLTGFSVLLDP